MFGRSKDYIAYNQTIDNDVLVFSSKGELEKIFRFDFGNGNVPPEAKSHIVFYDLCKPFMNYISTVMRP